MIFKQVVRLIVAASLAPALFGAELYVSVSGSNTNDGSAAKPFQTISAAARIAQPGDVITVHAGTYRERVTPPRGGQSDSKRITYRAAAGEVVEIKGSEVVRDWKPYRGDVWNVTLPNSFFGSYNPYKDLIAGDWFNEKGRPHHTGQVYMNGKALFEAGQIEGVLNPLPYPDARDKDASLWTWFTETDANNTTIFANFHGKNPNQELVEINVRDSCFYPDKPGTNFITVSGFRMRHAATQWAAPTAEQLGLIGTNWSKGWIIENNVISDSRCSCVALGKDRATGHNVWTANPMKGGATHYNEVILRALDIGWSKENIGSHIVRNNTIYNCEQGGIVGGLGAVNSRITGNHIYDIWARRQFTGAEMAGIKLHGAIDVLIKNNRVHNAGRGMWMDWMAQGTHITSNLLYDNTTDDLFFEVDHGPFVVDNNLFLSEVSLLDVSEGGAYAHNYFGGKVMSHPELNRWTPYHRAHSTALAGVTLTNGGDNRFYDNIFNGGVIKQNTHDAPENLNVDGYGTWVYNTRRFPSHVAGNVYLNGAHPYKDEPDAVELRGANPNHRVVEDGEHVLLHLTLDPAAATAHTVRVTTELLGKTQVAELGYEEVDGLPLAIDADYFGKPFADPKCSAGPFARPGSGEITLRVW